MVFGTVSGKPSLDRVIGFTLIELLVVMAIIATLLTIVMPHYFGRVDRAKETVLRQDLAIMRDALDKYYGDHAKYPDTLDDLVNKRYLRAIPADPVTGSVSTWIPVPPPDSASGGIYSVRSGAAGVAQDGTLFSEL